MPSRVHHYIKAWRQLRDLTQERLAERVNMNKGTVSRIERGEVPYSQATLEAFAEALSCEPADLLRPPPSDAADELAAFVKKLGTDKRRKALHILKIALEEDGEAA